MSWSTVKLAAKKSWVVLKNYWYVPALLIYTLAMWVIFRKDNTRLLEVFDIAAKKYKEEIEVLNRVHQEQIEKRNKLIEDNPEKIAEEMSKMFGIKNV